MVEQNTSNRRHVLTTRRMISITRVRGTEKVHLQYSQSKDRGL